MANTARASALRRKLSAGPLDYDFTTVPRKLNTDLMTRNGHQRINVVFEPFAVTQTSREYELNEYKKRSKHEQDWLVSAKLPV